MVTFRCWHLIASLPGHPQAQQSDQGGAPGDDTDGDGTAQGGGEPPTLEKLQKMMEEVRGDTLRQTGRAGELAESCHACALRHLLQIESCASFCSSITGSPALRGTRRRTMAGRSRS